MMLAFGTSTPTSMTVVLTSTLVRPRRKRSMTEPVFESWYSNSAHQRWAAGLVLAIVLLCVYWPVFSYDYLYYDDWIHFSGREVACSASPMYNWSRINGRPLG